MSAEKPPRFGPRGVPLAALTDAELLEEVQLRRRRRGVSGEAEPQPRVAPSRIAKYLANLELKAPATREEVDAAYARLRRKYEPFLEAEDAERRAAAKRLLASLTEAHDALQRHLG